MNPVGWFEIYVDDMKRATSFYEEVFETKLEVLNDDGDMQMMSFPGDMKEYGCNGALVKMPGFGPGNNSVLIYFHSTDCKKEESKAEQAGGSVVKSKFSIGEYGNVSLVKDTEGNMIGIHSME